jgi:Sulfotransferase family
MYDILLSAGGFASYRGYLPIYNMLIPHVGKLDSRENRSKLIEIWLRSQGFRRSGMDASALRAKVLHQCKTAGDFVRLTMDEIALAQNVTRWALYEPDNVLYIREIKADIPEALFVHMIRDGRDIALSLNKMGGFQPLPWDRGSRELEATAMYWEWTVRKGQLEGREFPADYIEVHYEQLVKEPQAVMRSLGEFLDHDLDYDRIQNAGQGRLRQSNSSFLGEQGAEGQANPVNRWRNRLTREEVVALESLVADCLTGLAYELTSSEQERQRRLYQSWMRFAYPRFLSAKLWLKTKTPLGRFSNLEALELADPIAQIGTAH